MVRVAMDGKNVYTGTLGDSMTGNIRWVDAPLSEPIRLCHLIEVPRAKRCDPLTWI